MLSSIMWGALSIFSFAIFIAFPSGPSGFNYMVLVPAFLSLTACMLFGSKFRERSTRRVTDSASSLYDHVVIARTEKLKQAQQEEQARMLRSQSSRRRSARN